MTTVGTGIAITLITAEISISGVSRLASVAEEVDIVSSPRAAVDTYGLGEIIRLRVRWDTPVVVTGTPQFPVNFGQSPTGQPEYADYDSGSGTTELDFIWVVAATDEDTNGIFVYGGSHPTTNEFNLNGGTIKASGTDADLTLPATQIGTQSNHKVDGSLVAAARNMLLWGSNALQWGSDTLQWAA